LEFLDKDHNVLSCVPLYQCCVHCRKEIWPKRFRQNVTYPVGAASMVIWEDRQKIYEEPIWEPPSLEVTGTKAELNGVPGISLKWHAAQSGRCVPPGVQGPGTHGPGMHSPALTYLVQWQDDQGNWRGVAPAITTCELFVPASLIARDNGLPGRKLRVLASSGIATTGTEFDPGTLEATPAPPILILRGENPTADAQKPAPMGLLLRAAVVHGHAAMDRGQDIRWFDKEGREIGRGRTLDCRHLPIGQHTISADAVHLGAGVARATWLVERIEKQVRILKRL
jgi:hypothetical protein